MRALRAVAVVLGGLSALAAVALLVLAALAPTTEETWAYAIQAYILMACAAIMLSGAGHLKP